MNTIKISIISICLLTFASSNGFCDLFKWVDEDGILHFSNVSPKGNKKTQTAGEIDSKESSVESSNIYSKSFLLEVEKESKMAEIKQKSRKRKSDIYSTAIKKFELIIKRCERLLENNPYNQESIIETILKAEDLIREYEEKKREVDLKIYINE